MTDSHVYTFYNSATNRYLSCNGQSLVLSQTPTNWMLKNANGKGFHLYAHETNLLMDIDNANVAVGTTVKLWTATGHDVQIWNINRNANGTYSILYSGDNQFCLGFAGERPVLQRWDGINKMQEWIVTDISDTLQKDYLSFKSNGNIIELQLPLDILNSISEARLKQWANELEAAYYTFYELTNFVPFQNIIVEAYKPSQHIGWVTEHSNVIHIDNAFIYGDLEKMAVRASDWNFCALHEMGHMFDFGRPWNFETELMTDFKLAYVLEKNHVAASPSEFDASTVFYGKDIRTAYATLGNDFSTNYDIYGCAERFLQIKEDIGWEPIKQTFYAMQANEASYRSYSKQAKLEAFVSLLSGYSNRDVKSYFSTAEWNTLLQKCQ